MSKHQDEQPTYGGRALGNGVVMVGPHAIAIAVRRSDGTIETAVESFTPPGRWARRIPVVRGVVTLVGAFKVGVQSTRLERRLTTPEESWWRRQLTSSGPLVTLALVERVMSELVRRRGSKADGPLLDVARGVGMPFAGFGIAGQLPPTRQLFEYHGAEHMAVNTVEAGRPLEPDEAAKMSRIHPRCGTTFAFWMLLGGSLLRRPLRGARTTSQRVAGIVSAPLLVGLAFEAVRFGARNRDNALVQALCTPAWQAQRLTTVPPTNDKLEVACAALQAVLDFERGPDATVEAETAGPLA